MKKVAEAECVAEVAEVAEVANEGTGDTQLVVDWRQVAEECA